MAPMRASATVLDAAHTPTFCGSCASTSRLAQSAANAAAPMAQVNLAARRVMMCSLLAISQYAHQSLVSGLVVATPVPRCARTRERDNRAENAE